MFSCNVFVIQICFFFFFKQKTAYEMRISDWSSDVCSSDLPEKLAAQAAPAGTCLQGHGFRRSSSRTTKSGDHCWPPLAPFLVLPVPCSLFLVPCSLSPAFVNRQIASLGRSSNPIRSEEHTSELQSIMRTSSAVFCLIKQTSTRS